jgi:hypothetical protein
MVSPTFVVTHRAPSSYVNARTVNDILHETFQQATLELSLVTYVTDALVCFQQSLGMATPYELRCLFVSLTVAGARTVNGIVHETFQQAA